MPSAKPQTTKRGPEFGETYYRVVVEKVDYRGRIDRIEHDGYALLRECLDDTEDEAQKSGWFKDELCD